MSNLIIGVFFGWVFFTATGRESFWNAYHVIDQMGEYVTAGMVKDMDIKPQEAPAKPQEAPAKPQPAPAKPQTDPRREAYIEMCSKYSFTRKQCETLWDKDDQTALTEDEKPVKIKQHNPMETL